MPHFPKVWPAGKKDGISTVQHQDLERIDSHVTKSLNGDDGGLWVPAALKQDTSSWTFSKASVAVQPTPSVDADGGLNATYVVDTVDNSQHAFIRYLPSFVNGCTYSFSTFAKKNGVRYAWMAQDGSGFVYFDLQGGVVGATGGSATGAIVSIGNGWYYCTATFVNFTSNRVFVGMSPNNGSATYAGTGTQGILYYKTLVDLETDTRKKRPVFVGGAGLTPTLTPTKNPTFGDPGGLRTFVRRLPALPSQLIPAHSLPTAGDVIQGLGLGTVGDRLLFLNDLPDGSTIVSVTAYFIVSNSLRVPLPTRLPGINVLRTEFTTGAETSLRATGRVDFTVGGQGIPDNYISPPAGPNVFPTTGGPGAMQQWTFTADQMNPVDRTTYFYSIRLKDEDGGTATPGNLFYGYQLTYVTSDLRPA